MTKMIALILLLLLSSCEGDEYRKLMEPALKAKLADNNPHPVFDGEEEPPIPDEKENNKTILGIDKNNNGIRDDIDIWINRTGKNYNERMAMRQLARADQAFLRAAVENNSDMAHILMNKSIDGEKCIDVIFSNHLQFDDRQKIVNNLRSLLSSPNERGKKIVGFYQYIFSYGEGKWGRHEDRFKYCTFAIANQSEVIEKYIDSFKTNWRKHE